MKKLQITSKALLIAALFLFKGMAVMAQCPNTFTNVSLDGGGNTITVGPGSSVNLTMNYDINNLFCSSCIVQHVIGLDNSPLDCIYNGVAATCPSTTTGSYSLTIVAPSTPGRYAINVGDQNAQFTCMDAQSSFAAGNKTQIGTITVCGNNYFDNVSLNGLGNNVTVTPGASVSIALDYEITNQVCSSCIVQHVIGIDNTPFDCIYNGVAPTCPQVTTNAYSYSFTAPTTPGVYAINVTDQQGQFTCQDAQNLFSGANKTQIATLTVCEGTTFTNVSMNGGGSTVSVAANSTINLSMDYTINNQFCSSCIVQHVVGIDNTALDCVYSGVANSCPSVTAGSYSYSFTAPGTPGTYLLKISEQMAQFTCQDALGVFASTGNSQIGVITVTSGVGLNETGGEAAFEMSPNPANEKINLSMKVDVSTDATIKIISVSGQTVYSESVLLIPGDFKKDIDVSNLPKGIYSVQMMGGSFNLIRKLMVQ